MAKHLNNICIFIPFFRMIFNLVSREAMRYRVTQKVQYAVRICYL